MRKFDLEDLLDGIKTIMTTHLNTKISAINSEKNDQITLKAVESGAYFDNTMDAAQANYDPFIFYGVSDMPGEASDYPGDSAYRAEIVVLICCADHGTDINISRRMLRYQRVLKEVFEERFDDAGGRCKLSVKTQVPVTIQLLNSSTRHKVVGVLLRTDLP